MNRDTSGGAVHGLEKRARNAGMTNHGCSEAGVGIGDRASGEAARMGSASVHQPRSGTSCAAQQGS